MKNIKFSMLNGKEKRWVFTVGIVIILIFSILSISCGVYLHNDKKHDDEQIKASITNGLTAENEIETPADLGTSDTAYDCYVGSYIENISALSVTNSTFTTDMVVWFTWYGEGKDGPADTIRLLEGTMKDKKTLEEYHYYENPENGEITEIEKGKEIDFIKSKGIDPDSDEANEIYNNICNYQRIKFTATVNKVFDITRVGLDNHTLAIRLEDSRDSTAIRYFQDTGENTSLMAPNVKIPGYSITGNNVSIKNHTYKTSYSDVYIDNPNKSIFTQYIATIDIKRDISSYFNLLAPFLILFFIAILSLFNRFKDRFRFALVSSALFGVVTAQRTLSSMIPTNNGELNLLSIMSLVTLLTILMLMIITIVSNRIYEKYDVTYENIINNKEKIDSIPVLNPAPVSKFIDIVSIITIIGGYIGFNIVLILSSIF